MARVLIVDDLPDARRLAARLLERKGHQVITAADGEEALALAAAGGYDVVLLDVSMPETDGFEVLRQLPVVCPDMPPPSVVMLTAESDQASQDLAAELGACDYLIKGSYDPSRLCELVASHAAANSGGHRRA